MITKYKIEKANLPNGGALQLETKIADIMESYKFFGYRKAVKWAIASHAFETALDRNDLNGENLEEYCRFYIDNIFHEGNR
jgi:hypothetical protein